KAVIRLEVVAKCLNLHAAVNVGVCAHRNRHYPGDAEVAEFRVGPGAELVVIARAEPDLDWNGQRGLRRRVTRGDTDLDIGALRIAGVGLAVVTELEGNLHI